MKPKLLFVILCLSIVAGAASYLSILSGDQTPKKDIKASYLKGGDFSLSNGGDTFRLEGLRGRPVILYFGFTFCPDICPVGLAVIRDALNADDAFSDLSALFVTLDPERDDATRMGEYVSFFHTSIIGLTGTLEEISTVATQYGTYFQKTKADADGAYSVDHTAYFYLIDEAGELVRVLDHNTPPEVLASELKKLI